MPNLISILSDTVIRCENATRSSVHKRLSCPIILLTVILDRALVSVHIRLKVGKTHKWIGNSVARIDKVICDVGEILTADRTVESVDNTCESRFVPKLFFTGLSLYIFRKTHYLCFFSWV